MIDQSQVEKAPIQQLFLNNITPVKPTNPTSLASQRALRNIVKYFKNKELLEADRKAKLQKLEATKQRHEEQNQLKKEERLKKRLRLKTGKKKLREKQRKKRLVAARFKTDREHRKFLIERFDKDFKPILGPVITELCKMQIKRKNSRKVLFTPLQMDIAVDIKRHCTPKAYNYLTTILPLPSFPTVMRAMSRRDVATAEAEKNRSCELDDQLDPSQSQQTDEINSSDDDLTFDEDSDIENEVTCEVNNTSVCTNNETHPIPQQAKNFHLPELDESFSFEFEEACEKQVNSKTEDNSAINRENRASPLQPLETQSLQLPELDGSFS